MQSVVPDLTGLPLDTLWGDDDYECHDIGYLSAVFPGGHLDDDCASIPPESPGRLLGLGPYALFDESWAGATSPLPLLEQPTVVSAARQAKTQHHQPSVTPSVRSLPAFVPFALPPLGPCEPPHVQPYTSLDSLMSTGNNTSTRTPTADIGAGDDTLFSSTYSLTSLTSTDKPCSKRRAYQRMESYERKKTRAKLCRRVLNERFECLLRTIGNPQLRRSDKCGLLTCAIDTIVMLRRQLTGLLGGPGLEMPPALFPTPPPLPLPDGPFTSPATCDAYSSNTAAFTAYGTSQVGGRDGVAGGSVVMGGEHARVQAVDSVFASAKLVLHIGAYLDPRSLEMGRSVSRSFRKAYSQDSPWKELCRKRWKTDATALEELRTWAGRVSWRQVYILHARDVAAPMEARQLSSAKCHRPPELGHGLEGGLAAWVTTSYTVDPGNAMLDRLPCAGIVGVLALRLTLQNVSSSDVIVLPYQCFAIRTHGPSELGVKRRRSNLSLNSCAATDEEGDDDSSEQGVSDEDAEYELKEATAEALREHGVTALGMVRAYQTYVDEESTAGTRVAWEDYKDAGELRLGLFDTVVFNINILPPGCSTVADVLTRASSMMLTAKVARKWCNAAGRRLSRRKCTERKMVETVVVPVHFMVL